MIQAVCFALCLINHWQQTYEVAGILYYSHVTDKEAET